MIATLVASPDRRWKTWRPLWLVVVVAGGASAAAGRSWLTHIAVDRVTGFGLRTKDGWQWLSC